MCGWTEPDDEIEEEMTLKGSELVIVIGIYTVAVLSLIIAFEYIMPVVNNPDYPFYNHKPNYQYGGGG